MYELYCPHSKRMACITILLLTTIVNCEIIDHGWTFALSEVELRAVGALHALTSCSITVQHEVEVGIAVISNSFTNAWSTEHEGIQWSAITCWYLNSIIAYDLCIFVLKATVTINIQRERNDIAVIKYGKSILYWQICSKRCRNNGSIMDALLLLRILISAKFHKYGEKSNSLMHSICVTHLPPHMNTRLVGSLACTSHRVRSDLWCRWSFHPERSKITQRFHQRIPRTHDSCYQKQWAW